MNTITKQDETKLAEEIVSVLPVGIARACSDDRESIRFAVRGDGIKLRSIVLSRASLRRLADDPHRAIKIEYLRRDLLDTASQRRQFRYPRLVRPVSKAQALPFGLPFASAQ
ncbi:MAG: hypothetical protein QOH21_3730 [Acidobacteriota bacterium]|jgi:hypothetical protein|nr:hypothetical protein [Acidobacteriota bacterium]